MTKQEEIREWLEDIFEGERLTIPRDTLVGQILSYLHSQGVVIKVKRELRPRYFTAYEGTDAQGYILARDDMLKAGYEAVESLIKEANNVYHQEKTK